MTCTQHGASTAAALALLVVLLTLTTMVAATSRELMLTSTTSMAAVMRTLKSPLSNSEASTYAQLYKNTRSVGDLCQAGHLYCDTQAYEAHYRKVVQPTEDNDITAFFRESQLLVGNQVTVVDPQLQSIAIERNSLALRADPRTSLYAIYVNVAKVPEREGERAFLPAELADALSITSLSAAQIFGFDESSTLAKESSHTIKMCTETVHEDGTTSLQGEAASCATSLEELQSLLRSPLLLGPHDANSVEALVTDSSLQSDFTGQVVAVNLKASESRRHAVCHNLMYPSTIFFCHYLPNTRVYTVTLRHEPSAKLLQAVAMCHLHTNGWNPGHLAFQNLHALPGQGEACHWVFQGSVIFVPAAAA